MTTPETAQDDARRIAITGATGLIGGALSEAFRADGYTIQKVSRSRPDTELDVQWSPTDGQIEADKLEGVDVVIHLAGENIFGLWTENKKQKILASRAQGTGLIAKTIAGLDRPPSTFISASGVDFYGDAGSQEVDETSPPGDTFLAEVCQVWEAACQPAADAGIRTLNTRMGAVLSKDGGALSLMLKPFKFGLGGQVGSGDQYMSWVSHRDVARAMRFLVDDTELAGPINLTSPNPVTNEVFTKTLARVLGRPALFDLPTFMVKLGGGQMAKELLLSGTRAVPRRLQESGFEFEYAELEAALQNELNQ
ncbi:MAG: TIGR01777 family oxidoreductase [Persicimonas sp.]